jgi:hypothetical protein
MNSVTYKQICDNYWFGYYDDFSVVLMRDCGFINATKLCKDSGKKLCDWKRTRHSQELITSCIVSLGGDAANIELVCKTTTTTMKTHNDKLISGIYFHPHIIASIAGWIQPEFQIRANRILYNFFIPEDVDYVINDVATAKPTSVNNGKQKVILKATHAVAMLKLHDPKAVMEYYVISCKRKKMTSSMAKLRRKHSQAEVIYHHRTVPNDVKIYEQLRQNRLVYTKRNYCQPNTSLDEIIHEMSRMAAPQKPALNVAPYNTCLWCACNRCHCFFSSDEELRLHQQSGDNCIYGTAFLYENKINVDSI